MSNDVTRARISALIGEIEQLQAEMKGCGNGDLIREPEDCEAYEIVRRIERNLKRNAVRAKERGATNA